MRKYIALLSTALSIVGVQATNAGIDAKIYPATGCSFSERDFTDPSIGWIENSDVASQKVICPIIRDYTLDNVKIVGSGETWVMVRDQNSGAGTLDNVSCSLVTSWVDSNGSYQTSVQQKQTTGTSSSWVKLAFDQIIDPDMTASYTLQCRVPGKDTNTDNMSGMGAYRIYEME